MTYCKQNVEFVEDVNGYEFIYSKKVLETPFIDNDNINEIDNTNTTSEDENEDIKTIKTCENKVDNSEKSSSSRDNVIEIKRSVGRPKKVQQSEQSIGTCRQAQKCRTQFNRNS